MFAMIKKGVLLAREYYINTLKKIRNSLMLKTSRVFIFCNFNFLGSKFSCNIKQIDKILKRTEDF